MTKLKRLFIYFVQPKILTWVLSFLLVFTFIWQNFGLSKKLQKANIISSRYINGLHELSSVEPYSSRIRRIHEKCPKQNKKLQFSIRKRTFIYVDKIKVVMCETPKVASTTWQLALLRLSGFKKKFTKELLKKWAYNIIPNKNFGNHLRREEMFYRMQNYTTFLVTRHPFERLVSAYYDKLSNRSKYHAYRERVGIAIAKRYPPNHLRQFNIKMFSKFAIKEEIQQSNGYQLLTPKEQNDILTYLNGIRTGEVSFPQFVEFLSDYYTSNNLNAMDIHWRPQSLLCQPCLFNYSYVIKFENLSNESNRLLDYLQRSYNLSTSLIEQVRFTEQVNPKTRNKLTQETIRLIPESQVETLREIYRDDFLFYGYDPYLYKGY